MMKRMLAVMGILSMSACLTVPAAAATRNVTDQVSAKTMNNVKKLTRRTTTYAEYQISYKLKYGQTKQLDFSKTSARKQLIRISYMDSYGKSQSSISKDLFGRSTPKVKPVIGEWGEDGPVLKNYRIYKKSNSTYTVKANVFMVGGNMNEKDGNVNYTLKKKQGSRYGFVMKKMAVTRTNRTS